MVDIDGLYDMVMGLIDAGKCNDSTYKEGAEKEFPEQVGNLVGIQISANMPVKIIGRIYGTVEQNINDGARDDCCKNGMTNAAICQDMAERNHPGNDACRMKNIHQNV